MAEVLFQGGVGGRRVAKNTSHDVVQGRRCLQIAFLGAVVFRLDCAVEKTAFFETLAVLMSRRIFP